MWTVFLILSSFRSPRGKKTSRTRSPREAPPPHLDSSSHDESDATTTILTDSVASYSDDFASHATSDSRSKSVTTYRSGVGSRQMGESVSERVSDRVGLVSAPADSPDDDSIKTASGESSKEYMAKFGLMFLLVTEV